MSQVFEENGKVIPVTLLKVLPNTVIRIKTKDKDGYDAVQIGTGTSKNIKKPQKIQYKDLGNLRFVREFDPIEGQDLKTGDKIDVSTFTPGEVVKISGVSKGKGFAGGMKRHGFKGMPASHGHTHVRRHMGSIGQRFPQHTLKGTRMSGHLGARNTTVKGLKVVDVDAENNILIVKGAVPGIKGRLLKIVSEN